MIEWSSMYETHIKLVDDQHKRLFEMLNSAMNELEHGAHTSEKVYGTLDELQEFAFAHFIDEERLMAQLHIDNRHVRLQRMEHHSFIFDVQKMRAGVMADDALEEQLEQLVKFIGSWLVYHTLRTDQSMAVQVAHIKNGRTPAEAYDLAESHSPSAAINQKVLEAVLSLWAEAAERVNYLEAELGLRSPEAKESDLNPTSDQRMPAQN